MISIKSHELLKQYIKEKGFKQKRIAEKLSVTQNTLSETLSGKRRLEADRLIKILDCIEVDIKDFYNRLMESRKN